MHLSSKVGYPDCNPTAGSLKTKSGGQGIRGQANGTARVVSASAFVIHLSCTAHALAVLRLQGASHLKRTDASESNAESPSARISKLSAPNYKLSQ